LHPKQRLNDEALRPLPNETIEPNFRDGRRAIPSCLLSSDVELAAHPDSRARARRCHLLVGATIHGPKHVHLEIHVLQLAPGVPSPCPRHDGASLPPPASQTPPRAESPFSASGSATTQSEERSTTVSGPRPARLGPSRAAGRRRIAVHAGDPQVLLRVRARAGAAADAGPEEPAERGGEADAKDGDADDEEVLVVLGADVGGGVAAGARGRGGRRSGRGIGGHSDAGRGLQLMG
ncbi:hypothetical protein BDY21DRAFT_390117, partial [Lineolata rhizophorae]